MSTAPTLLLLCGSLLRAGIVQPGMPVPARTWTDDQGRSFEAELLRLEGDEVVFRDVKSGEEYRRAAERLSEADRQFVISRLVKSLRNRSERLRAQASAQLVEIGLDAVPALIEELNHKNGGPGSAQTLVKIGEPAIPLLLGRRRPINYTHTLSLLALRRGGQRIPAPILGGTSRRTRPLPPRDVLDRIEDRSFTGVVDPVVEVLLQMPREALLGALRREQPGVCPGFITELTWEAELMAYKGVAVEERIVDVLAALVEHESDSVRCAAEAALVGVLQKDNAGNPTAAIGVFTERLSAADPKTRLEAASALCWRRPGLLGGYMVPRPDARGLIFSTLADVLTESTDPEARQQASELFCRLGLSVDPQIVPDLARLAGVDDLPGIKGRAVGLLGEAGADADTAVPALIEQLKNPDDSQRAAVVRALRRIGVSEPGHIDALMTAAKNSDDGVCASIVNGFVRGDFGPIDRPQLARLRRALTSNRRLTNRWKGIIIAQTRRHPAWKR